MKRHPLLVGFGVFAGLLLLFGFVVYAVMSQMDEGDKKSWFKKDSGGKVAVFYLRGPIFESEEGVKQLETYRKNKSVKAVILRINSPGGLVAPSQELYEAVKDLREEKIVIVSFGDIAASGAYYVAAGADGIMANPGSLTGSIGVIMQMQNFEGLLEWAKIKSHILMRLCFRRNGPRVRHVM